MSRAKKQLKARRRRERSGYGGRPRVSPAPTRRPFRELTLLSYTISSDALDLPKEAESDFPGALDKDERQALHNQVYNAPRLAIPKLEALRDTYSNSPMLLNWLAAALSHAGEGARAEEVSRLNYQLHPDYFFARANYADFCLKRGDLEGVREVFGDKFDLKLMYPHRDVFHLSEFVAFCSVTVEYLMRTGETTAAHKLFDVLEDMCPDHPVTEQLRSVIEGSLLLKLAKKLQQGMLRAGFVPGNSLTSRR